MKGRNYNWEGCVARGVDCDKIKGRAHGLVGPGGRKRAKTQRVGVELLLLIVELELDHTQQ